MVCGEADVWPKFHSALHGWRPVVQWVTTVLVLIPFFLNNCIVPMGFLPWEIRVAFPGESQLRQGRVTQLTVHAGCFSVSIIYRTLTWTTGSLTCAQM